MSMKKTIVLILIMSVLLSTTGCHKAVPRQSDRHEGIEEFEDEVFQELGDYISIGKPLLDNESGKMQLCVLFLSDYVASEEMQGSKSYYEVIEEFRLAFNDYYSRNPNWIVSKYSYVLVSFYIEPEGGLFNTEGSVLIADLSNWGVKESYDNLATVDYSIYNSTDNYQYLMSCEGVRCIYIDDEFSSITEIIDSMPDLSSVYVFDASYVERLSELYPDIAFAECTWFHY